MKKIGLIGGLSWVSTAAYYERLNQITNEELGGVHSAHLVLESVDRQRYVTHVRDEGDETAACEMILSAARAIEAGGATFIVMTCNDIHRFVPHIEPLISIPFLHIADATGKAIKEAGLKRVALMGVKQTMEGDFYPTVLKRHEIDTMIPAPEERQFIDDTIMQEMVKDQFLDATRSKYVELINELQQRGAEGIILGCTELPLLIQPTDTDVPTFSTNELHCRAAIELAISNAD